MSKITFEFNLPEEDSEFEACANARNLATILWDLDQWLTDRSKFYETNTIKAYEVRDVLRDKLKDAGMTWECVIWK
jgi:hypothetical protein